MISVVVPSVRSNTIGSTIEALQNQSDPDWDLVISDQSGNESLVRLLEKIGDSRIRRVACVGRGASLARNVGILHTRIVEAESDIIAFTDDDCCPRTDWIAKIRAAFATDPELWMVTGSIVPPPDLANSRGIFTCPGYIPDERRGRPSEGDYRIYSVTANAAYRRYAFQKAGPFDICLSPGTEFCGGEEDDHGQRMELFDPVLLSTPRLEVEHTHGVRYGSKAVWRIKRNYAYSVGAVAAKMTLLNGSGRKRMSGEASQIFANLTRRSPLHAIRGLPRLFYVWQGYRRLIANYQVDERLHLLLPRGKSLDQTYAPIASMLDYRLPL